MEIRFNSTLKIKQTGYLKIMGIVVKKDNYSYMQNTYMFIQMILLLMLTFTIFATLTIYLYVYVCIHKKIDRYIVHACA